CAAVPRPPASPLFPYTTLFRSVTPGVIELKEDRGGTVRRGRDLIAGLGDLQLIAARRVPPHDTEHDSDDECGRRECGHGEQQRARWPRTGRTPFAFRVLRSEEHTSELQSR